MIAVGSALQGSIAEFILSLWMDSGWRYYSEEIAAPRKQGLAMTLIYRQIAAPHPVPLAMTGYTLMETLAGS